jgi:hypothetical protein
MATAREELEQLRALERRETAREELARLRAQDQATQQPIADDVPRGTRRFPERTAFETGLVGMGRGFKTIGRAIGLAEPETEFEAEAVESLKEKRPVSFAVGEILGEAAPFVPAGIGIGAIRALTPRVLAATGLGGLEGLAITRGRGEDIEQQAIGAGIGATIAGGLEAIFPVIGRIGGALVQRVKGHPPKGALFDENGVPSDELRESMQDAGVTFEDLTQEAIENLKAQKPGADPEQATRLARFEALGIEPTRGDITQEFTQQRAEAQLLESGEPLAGELRTLRLEQSQAFKSQLDNAIAETGLPQDVGDNVKEALIGRKKLLRNEKNELYREAAERAPQIQALPIDVGDIVESVPDATTFNRISRLRPSEVSALDDLLVEYGIDRTEERVTTFLKGTTRGQPNQITPLDVGSLEDFRQQLNIIERADQSGAIKVLTGPIKSSLDEEANLLDDALRRGGVTEESILEPLKEARKRVRELKTEFSPQSISGRLIDAKRDGVTPIVEASKVYNELMGAGKAPELLKKTLANLRKAPGGSKAIGDLQARTVMDLLETSFKAQTRKVAGERVFSGVAFNRRLEQIGEDRLKDLFKNQPQMLKKLKQIGKAAEEITPPSGAVPKGSASVILQQLNRLGIISIANKLPGGIALAEMLRTFAEKGQNRAALEKALDAKPEMRRLAETVNSEMPSIAASIGIPLILQEEAE